MTLVVRKSQLDDLEARTRVYFPSVNLRVHSIDGVMYVLKNDNTNKDLSGWVSRNEMAQILKALCNVTREELCARLEGFVENRQLEKLFQEQEYELRKWEKYDINKTNKHDVNLET
jgi:hypothetical protein